jgi:hypothetical protein
MAFRQDPHCLSVPIAGTVTKKRFVNYNGTQAVANQNTIGVAVYGGVSGDCIEVDHLGVTAVEAGAVINGSELRLQTDAQGRAVPYTTGPTVAKLFPGQTATAAGQEISVTLMPN